MKLLMAVILMAAAAHGQTECKPSQDSSGAVIRLCAAPSPFRFVVGNDEPRVDEITALKAEIAKLRAELEEVKATIAYPCKWGEHFVLNDLQMTGGEGKCMPVKPKSRRPAAVSEERK
jgi:hypothetical protein